MIEFNKDIVEAKICPYCGDAPELVDSELIYGRSYGNIYLSKCGAYVGVHKKDNTPLGRLANRELREAKKLAHYHFDKIWNNEIENGTPRKEARSKAYKWLSESLGIIPKHTHIGMFDVDTCLKVVDLCKNQALING